MNLTEFSKEIHAGNAARGFYDVPRTFPHLAMLVVSELSEAVEADRNGKRCSAGRLTNALKAQKINGTALAKLSFETHVKDTMEDEIADTIIRLLDLCGYLGIDIDGHVRAKLAYNATREAKHGKAY
jgi:NTP pyrophosphatase (non-canonical NTP hydrolase)